MRSCARSCSRRSSIERGSARRQRRQCAALQFLTSQAQLPWSHCAQVPGLQNPNVGFPAQPRGGVVSGPGGTTYFVPDSEPGRVQLSGLQPMGRMGETQEITDAVMYLEKSAFVTGEILHVDGGASAGRW